MAYNVGNFPDNWIVSDDDQTFYREGFDDTWLEQSLPLPSENGHHLGGQTQDIPRSMSLVHARYATSENSMSSVEESPSMDKPTADDRPRKGRKPKPHMDGESSAEVRVSISSSLSLNDPTWSSCVTHLRWEDASSLYN